MKTLKIACLGLLLTLASCTSNGQSFSQTVQDNQVLITTAATVATDLTLIHLNDKDRVPVAIVLTQVANATNAALSTDGADLSQVRLIVIAQLQTKDPRYLPVAVTLFDALSASIESVINNKLNGATADEKLQAIRSLVQSMANGIIVGCSQYVTAASLPTSLLPNEPCSGPQFAFAETAISNIVMAATKTSGR